MRAARGGAHSRVALRCSVTSRCRTAQIRGQEKKVSRFAVEEEEVTDDE